MSSCKTVMHPKPDYYEILQVHPKASLAVIKKAYRTLLMEMGHHPDMGGDPVIAALITEAYQVLSDIEARADYDRDYFNPLPTKARPVTPEAPAPAPATSLVVLCPSCLTKNRVRSQDVLDIAKCSRCGQKLSRLPNPALEFFEQLKSGVGQRLKSFGKPKVDTPPSPRTVSKAPVIKRPQAKLWSIAIPLLLLAASGITALWATVGDPGFGDPLEAAERLKQQNRPEDAKMVLQRAIDRDTTNPRLHQKLGETYMQQHEFSEAASHFGAASQLDRDNAYLFARQGRAFYQMNNFDAAEAAYKQAVLLDRFYDQALYDLGNIHARRGRYDEAAAYYRRALEVRPSADLYYNLGLVQKQGNRNDKAISAFRAALMEDPNHRASMVQLAAIYYERGEYDMAAAQYMTASALKHEDLDLHLKLADIYERTGRKNLAIREWSTALAQAGTNKSASTRARKALSKLGVTPVG